MAMVSGKTVQQGLAERMQPQPKFQNRTATQTARVASANRAPARPQTRSAQPGQSRMVNAPGRPQMANAGGRRPVPQQYGAPGRPQAVNAGGQVSQQYGTPGRPATGGYRPTQLPQSPPPPGDPFGTQGNARQQVYGYKPPSAYGYPRQPQPPVQQWANQGPPQQMAQMQPPQPPPRYPQQMAPMQPQQGPPVQNWQNPQAMNPQLGNQMPPAPQQQMAQMQPMGQPPQQGQWSGGQPAQNQMPGWMTAAQPPQSQPQPGWMTPGQPAAPQGAPTQPGQWGYGGAPAGMNMGAGIQNGWNTGGQPAWMQNTNPYRR